MSLRELFPSALLYRKLDELFGIDVRSLALTRIVIALTVLADLCIRAESLTLYLGERGVMPANLLYSLFPLPWSWSFHAWPGMPDTFLVSLLAVHACVALCVLVGYRTQFATVLLYVFTVSLQHANPFVLQGGDTLQLLIIFICIFLPWGTVYSLDSRRLPPEQRPARVLSGWSAALLLQMGFLYLFTFLLKTGPEWSDSYTAVYYALASGVTQTWIGLHLLAFPNVLKLCTAAVLILEGGAILFLFFPVWTVRIRTVTVGALIGMHTAFMLCLKIGLFSPIAIAGLLAFVPGIVWGSAPRFASPSDRPARSPQTALARALSALGICYIMYVAMLNIAYLRDRDSTVLGKAILLPQKIFTLNQRWLMYAPSPSHFNGWHAVRASTDSGNDIDLFRDAAPYTMNPPSHIAALYRSERDRKFMMIIVRTNPRVPQSVIDRYATVMCERWNASHHDRIRHLSVLLMYRGTVLPGERPMPIIEKKLAETDCHPTP